MEYSFNIEIAEKYGVNEAIMLNNFMFWIKKNIANGTNNFDDNWWTFNSARAFKDLFPFWSESQIRRILKSLIEKGILIEGNYNKVAYDRTKWYAICKSRFEEFHLTKSSNGSNERVTPIPDNKPDNKPDKRVSSILDEYLQSDNSCTELTKNKAIDFIDYRKKIKKPLKTIAPLTAYIKTLRELIHEDVNIDEAIAMMKEREWQTLKAEYILKDKKSSKVTSNFITTEIQGY